jgi:hypothetical protein
MKAGIFVPLGWVKTAALLAWYLGVWPTIIWFGVIQFAPVKWLQVATPLWVGYSAVITVALVLSQAKAGATPVVQQSNLQPQKPRVGA